MVNNPKPRPNHKLYLQTLHRMTPEQRLLAFMHHSQLMTQLYLAGRAAARVRSSPEKKDAS